MGGLAAGCFQAQLAAVAVAEHRQAAVLFQLFGKNCPLLLFRELPQGRIRPPGAGA